MPAAWLIHGPLTKLVKDVAQQKTKTTEPNPITSFSNDLLSLKFFETTSFLRISFEKK
jgi:hypothetical protein